MQVVQYNERAHLSFCSDKDTSDKVHLLAVMSSFAYYPTATSLSPLAFFMLRECLLVLKIMHLRGVVLDKGGKQGEAQRAPPPPQLLSKH